MSENKYPIGGYAPDSDARAQAPTFDEIVGLIKKLFSDYLQDVTKSTHEEIEKAWQRYKTLNHLYQDDQPKPAGARWVKATDRLPDVFNGKCHPRFVRIERKGHSGKVFVVKAVAYYFPEHFKSVVWEDWDDYSEEDFPYTESDEQRGVVWLKPGWYADVECDACDNSHWSAPLNVIEWLDESGAGGNDAIEFAEWCAFNYQRDFEPLDSSLPINERKYRQFWIDNDQTEYTTTDLYKLWQQSKSK